MIRSLVSDLRELSRSAFGKVDPSSLARTLVLDAAPILFLIRTREVARKWHIPGVNRTLRLLQMTVYGIDIGNDVTFGEGVYIVHSVGTVIGGTARVGARVRFMGNNTIGTAKDNGCPILEDDVVVGCGARVLGPVRVGQGAVIGANAVVLSDVAPGEVVTGIPAKAKSRAASSNGTSSHRGKAKG